MLVIPGAASRDTCDGLTRRDLLRVGGSGILGVSLAQMFALQKASANETAAQTSGGPGFDTPVYADTTLYGGTGDDHLTGGDRTDTLYADPGDDVL